MRFLMRLFVAFVVLAGVRADSQTQDEKPPRPIKDVSALLGKDHLSNELQQFREQFKDALVASYFAGDDRCFYHSWKNEGVSLRFNGENKLETILLYSGGVEGYQRYQGELPEKISFADNADVVEKKLGRPDEILGGVEVRRWWEYESKGIHVTFATFDPDDRKAPIAWIVLFQPKKNK